MTGPTRTHWKWACVCLVGLCVAAAACQGTVTPSASSATPIAAPSVVARESASATTTTATPTLQQAPGTFAATGSLHDPHYGGFVVPLKDGRVLMLIRNGFGCIAKSYSTDHGETWSKPELIPELEAPIAPSSIARIPATGDLLLIWNRNKKERRPLNSAISRDEGKTWESIRVIDDGDGPPWPGFAYTSITPVDDKIILTYWQYEATHPEWKLSLKLKSFDYRWFYEAEK